MEVRFSRANFGVLSLGCKSSHTPGIKWDFGFLNNFLELIFCGSLKEIGEMVSVTPARAMVSKYHQINYKSLILR